MEILTKKQVCKLLHISTATLQRRMKSGKYKFAREGEGKWAQILFTYEGIGLQEPAPPLAPIPLAVSHPTAPDPEPEESVSVPSVSVTGFQPDGSFVTQAGRLRKFDEATGTYFDSGQTVIVESQCNASTDGKRLFSRDGFVYERNSEGHLFRTGARRVTHVLDPLSEASDSVIRHPFSVQRQKAPRASIKGGWGGTGGTCNAVDSAEYRERFIDVKRG